MSVGEKVLNFKVADFTVFLILNGMAKTKLAILTFL